MSGVEVKPIRIPLAVPFVTREIAKNSGGTYTLDSYLINAYLEATMDGRKYVIKRPGLTTVYTYTGVGQGTQAYKGQLYAVANNVLNRLTTTALNGAATGAAWTSAPDATWNIRARSGCIVFNGQIFVMGGVYGGALLYLNDVWASSDGASWTQIVSAAPWTARSGFGLVVLGGLLYLMGGQGNGQFFNDVWSTPDGVNWTQVIGSAPWAARRLHGCVAFNQGIFLMGGDGGTAYLNDVWFSPDGLTWTQMVVTATWSARYGFSLLSYSNKLWVAGGYNGAALNSVYSSTDGIRWVNTGNLPATRMEMASTVYIGKMFFVAGDSGAGGTQTVWSSTDGVTFTVVAASYGGNNLTQASLVVFRTTNTVSSINAPTMWLIGGSDSGVGYSQLVRRATLNISLPATFSIGTAGAVTDQFQFTTQNLGQYLILKNASDAWVYYWGLLTKITSSNYPTSTVPGVVNLDDTVYVMGIDGTIYGSNLSDPFTWSSLNFIVADYASDEGVMLCKWLNYVLALKTTTMQLFRDAGRYPGSPLLPELSANSRIGCMSASTVAVMNNTVIWVARSDELGPHVVMMEGGYAVKISTSAVDKLLSAWVPGASTDRATGIRINGHDFYLLTLGTFTLYCDLTEKQWGIWQSGTSGTFVGGNYVTDGIIDYLQDMTAGKVYLVSPLAYKDDSTNITCVIQDLKIDFGTNDKKRTGSVTVIGDRQCPNAPNSILIQWSDNDAQTFNTGFSVDLSSARPRLPRQGSFRRRTYKLTHASNNPMRLEALELEVLGK